jgi:hypothetical protein
MLECMMNDRLITKGGEKRGLYYLDAREVM